MDDEFTEQLFALMQHVNRLVYTANQPPISKKDLQNKRATRDGIAHIEERKKFKAEFGYLE